MRIYENANVFLKIFPRLKGFSRRNLEKRRRRASFLPPRHYQTVYHFQSSFLFVLLEDSRSASKYPRLRYSQAAYSLKSPHQLNLAMENIVLM